MRKVVDAESVGVVLGILSLNESHVCRENLLSGCVLLTVEGHSEMVLEISPAHGERDIRDGNNWEKECGLHVCK
jgi:hypothetical protein